MVDVLIDFSVQNFKLFRNLDFSLQANRNIKKLRDNLIDLGEYSILKSAVIFGPNNSGKSSLLKALKVMRDLVITGETKETVLPYLLTKQVSNVVDFSILFAIDADQFTYDFSVLLKEGAFDFIHEQLFKNEQVVFERTENHFTAMQEAYQQVGELLLNTESLSLATFGKSAQAVFPEAQVVYQQFQKMIFIDGNDRLFPKKSLAYLADGKRQLLNAIMKCSDLSIDEIELSDQAVFSDLGEEKSGLNQDVEALLKVNAIHQFANSSVKFPLVLFESEGTQRLFALAGEIIDAIENDKMLFIDEIDNSFHTMMTRSIYNLFNLSERTQGQLIATTHDLLLLENKYLFRKDQIWFTEKSEREGFLYSLDDFTADANEGGIRSGKSNLLKKYLADTFGALPSIDVMEILANLEADEEIADAKK